MRVRVCYTVEYSAADLKALARATANPTMARSDVRGMLEDLGTMGVQELMTEGADKLQWEKENDA